MKKNILIFAILLVSTVNAQLNVKTIESVTLDITQTGTLRINGNVLEANLSYYIPQEGLKSINVEASGDMTWRYTFDAFNNKLVLLEWKKPSGAINYRVEMVVENAAKHTYSDKPVGVNPFYLKETSSVKIDDSIRQFAFPFEKSMKRAAELTKFVYDYLEYDLSYVGRNVPSDRVLAERRGVCVEHANLLTALLRANEMPARYVVGYAYSSVQDEFIGHTWVEVMADDGSWVPFDPTWLQAGYLDAAHIKNAVLLDNSQIDTLTYIGGSIDWTRNEEEIDLLNYTENNITSISVSGTGRVPSENYGYMKATASANECTIIDIKASSCVNEFGAGQLDIKEPERSFWTCGQKDVYWFFKAAGNNYICPVRVYDQTGAAAEYSVSVQGRGTPQALSISGPGTAGVNERFTLTASENGIFYSPEFGLHEGTSWGISAKNPGTYKFYLYSDGGLYVKNVNVVQKKEFELSVAGPPYAKLKDVFEVNVTVKNLLERNSVTLAVKYTNQTIRDAFTLGSNEERTLIMALEANKAGLNDMVVSVTGNSFASETLIINTPQEKGAADGFFKAVSDFFGAIADFFTGLLGK